VFENRVPRKIVGPGREKATGKWRILQNEELNNLHSSPNIVRVMESRRMRRAGHVARMGRGVMHTGFWWGTLRERVHLEDPGVDWRIILRWILTKLDVGVDWIDLARDRDRWPTLVNVAINLRAP
jgi:hypothetical protein